MIDTKKTWQDIFESREWGKYPHISVIQFIARNFYKNPNRSKIKILELGSGTGANLWFCAREGFKVSAIEFTEKGVEIMKERFRKENLTDMLEQVEIGDFYEKLDCFEDNYFDAIIDVESLCCNEFKRTKEILTKAYSKLKVGGKLLSVTFTEQTRGFVGKEISYHGMIVAENLIAGGGFCRYTTRHDIYELYIRDNITLENIGQIINNYSESEPANVVSEWVITSTKK